MKVDFCAKYEGGQFQFHEIIGVRAIARDTRFVLIIGSHCHQALSAILHASGQLHEVAQDYTGLPPQNMANLSCPFLVTRELLVREFFLERVIKPLNAFDHVVCLPLLSDMVSTRNAAAHLLSSILLFFGRGVPFDTTRPDDEVQNLVRFIATRRPHLPRPRASRRPPQEVLEGEEV